MHAVIDSQKNQDTHLLVPAGDHIHGYGSSKLEGEQEITLGFVDLLCDNFIEKDQNRSIF